MKHITRTKGTKAALSMWAGQERLAIASYYFWSAGATLQKSLYGLLCSLLHDILDQVLDAIQKVCSQDFFRQRGYPHSVMKWSLSGLQKCLHNLSIETKLRTRFSLFIDGLDKYQGDHPEICKILEDLCKSPDIKICTSSRPWNVFENSFGNNDRLKFYMQCCTQDDIMGYATDRLHGHPRWSESCLGSPTGAGDATLVDEIINRAQGVFLWVFLVAHQLREGLTNDVTADDLWKRLESIPTDLELFFKQILESVDHFYHEKMAQTLLVAVQHVATGIPILIGILAFHDMESGNPNYALDQRV
ncbi:hypothetical protein B0H63DRAFT_497767 [Podospora didyma]|uniref:Nephrocystin 3-like N-terminal domain-containing protein n=1 Tax=Podospora didyma TaxID=330526 RepID=A0AAE0K2U5_9PEZI|nr:hypothetical protein B0H63DRAFT_497767 [Podospora didyma]